MIGSLTLIILAGLIIGLGIVAIFWKLKPSISHGSAGFGSWPGPSVANKRDLPAGLVCGRTENGQLAGWDQEGHWLLVAPTGAGKSTGVLAPSICHWDASLMAIDVKGELATLCAPILQAKGIRCLRIDPFDMLGDRADVQKVSLDPVELAAATAEPTEAIRALADILIDPANGSDAHWAESAQMVTGGLIAAASCASTVKHRGLRGVAHLTEEGFAAIKMLERLRWPEHIEPLVLRTVKMLSDAGGNERGAMMSTIRRQLDFLTSKPVVATLSGQWQVAELVEHENPIALFVILPADRLATQARLLRIVVGTVASALLAAGTNRERRILFALDEAAALGKLAAVEQGIGLFRGYGAHFLLAFQDRAQIIHTYGEASSQSIMANCHALYWSCRDLATAKYVSELLGEHTVLSKSRDLARMPLATTGQTAENETKRRLLTTDEVRRLSDKTLLAFVAGHRPIKLGLLSPEETMLATMTG